MTEARGSVRSNGHLSVVLAVLWLSQIGLVLRAVAGELAYVRHAGRLLIDVAALLLMYAGFRAIRTRAGVRHGRRWVVAVLATAGWCAASGLIRSDVNLINWVVIGVLPFFAVVGVHAIEGTEEETDRLVKHLVWQVGVAVALAVGVLIVAPPAGRVEWNGEFGDGPAKLASRALFGLPFVVAFAHRLGRSQLTVVAAALVVWNVLAITGAGRGMLLVGVVILPSLIIVSAWRQRGRVRLLGFSVLAAGMIALGLGAAAITGHAATMTTYLESRLEESVGRLARVEVGSASAGAMSRGTLEASADEFAGEGGRAGELKDFLAQVDLPDYFIGRGFGASWRSAFWGTDWPIVHFGPAHLFFLGGIPLLFAFVGLFAVAVMRAWVRMPFAPAAAGAFCYCVTFIQTFLQHGVPGDDPALYMLWICTGLALTTPTASVRAPAYTSAP